MAISGKLTDADKAAIVRRYQAGEAIASIARAYHVKNNSVRWALRIAGVYEPGRQPVAGNAEIQLWDYYLDILEWAIPPLTVSTRDDRVSGVAIATLSSWGYLQRTGLQVGRNPLWETSPAGITALRMHGRSDTF